MRRSLILHIIAAMLESFALVYMLVTEGPAVFRYYTVLSNVIFLIVSVWYLYCYFARKEIPVALTVLHLTAAVVLTVTFIIAAFVLMPQSTFAYYFLDNVAPILHFLGPVLSVVTFILSDRKVPHIGFLVPAALTILYGIVALVLNILRVLEGPYFFLEVYSTPVGTIAMWFGIIFVLCVFLSIAYMFMHKRVHVSIYIMDKEK